MARRRWLTRLAEIHRIFIFLQAFISISLVFCLLRFLITHKCIFNQAYF